MCFQKKQNRFAQNIIGKKTKIENKELTEKEKKEANVKFKEFLKTMKVDKEN